MTTGFRCPRCDELIPLKEPGTPGVQRKWCSDDCRRRAWDVENRRHCVDCGELLSVHTHLDRNTPAERCQSCERARRSAQRDSHIETVARLYNEGASLADISAALGWAGSPNMPLREARRRGLIGYRYRGYGSAA